MIQRRRSPLMDDQDYETGLVASTAVPAGPVRRIVAAFVPILPYRFVQILPYAFVPLAQQEDA